MSTPAIPQSVLLKPFAPANTRFRAAQLYPKEHGAYAILGVPLATALIIAGATPATLLIAVAAVAAFLSHEPLLIVSGRRGQRARESTPAAMRALVGQMAVVVVCGSIAVIHSDTITRLVLFVCLLVAAVEFSAAVGGWNRTLGSQLLAIGSLTLPSVAVLTVGGVNLDSAIQFWLIWVTGRVSTTVSVRTMILRHRSYSPTTALRVHDVLLAVAIAVCGIGLYTTSRLWVITAPMLVAAIIVRMVTPEPRRLKEIGWTFLAVNLVSGLLMVGLWNL